MKTTKQKLEEALFNDGAETYEDALRRETEYGSSIPELKKAREKAQAALDVVTDILIKESYEMLKHAETLPCSSMKLEQMDFAKGVKMAADKLRSM